MKTVFYVDHVYPDSRAVAEFYVEDKQSYKEVYVKYERGDKWYQYSLSDDDFKKLLDAPSLGNFFPQYHSAAAFYTSDIEFRHNIKDTAPVLQKEEVIKRADLSYTIHYDLSLTEKIAAIDENTALTEFHEAINRAMKESGRDAKVKITGITRHF